MTEGERGRRARMICKKTWRRYGERKRQKIAKTPEAKMPYINKSDWGFGLGGPARNILK
jgi:hypothetical protein